MFTGDTLLRCCFVVVVLFLVRFVENGFFVRKVCSKCRWSVVASFCSYHFYLGRKSFKKVNE